jgi:hypothetical protein
MPIQPIISENFTGVIWRIEIDELSETVFLEVRNNEEKKVYFAGISLLSGEVLFKDITTPERWLTGIEAAYDGVLLLHFYQTDAGPTHKGLMAIDAGSTEVLWSNYIYTFDHLSVKGPVVYDAKIHPRKFFLADVKTGATTRIYQPSVYAELKNSVLLPAHISADELPVKLFSIHPFGNRVHYLEYNNFRIVSLHALKGGALNHWLYIFDVGDPANFREVYEDLLNADIQKLQPEAFIFHKNHLIYIKNKSELKVVTL